VGLGAEAILPLPVVFAVALLVTAVVMAPVALETLQVIEAMGGIEAMQAGGLAIAAAIFEPLRAFVQVHAAPDEAQFFAQLQGRAATDPLVLVPAFLVTELAEAMAMAVVIIVPLVLVDLLTAQVLVLWGLVNQPTAVVTVPLKLLLFLAVGGWDVVIGGLVEGYA
jgi:flagellar biosynthesis protein FliP